MYISKTIVNNGGLMQALFHSGRRGRGSREVEMWSYSVHMLLSSTAIMGQLMYRLAYFQQI